MNVKGSVNFYRADQNEACRLYFICRTFVCFEYILLCKSKELKTSSRKL